MPERSQPHPGPDGVSSPGSASSTTAGPPVDDHTHDVLLALTSKLEAIEAYGVYRDADDSGLFNQLLADEQRHAQLLLAELRSLLMGSAGEPHR